MPTNVYIDGFNFYYGAVRNTPFKWLNFATLCAILLPNRQIKRIRYFTAIVNGLPHDQQAPVRQQIFLRALKTIPNLTIHLGRFSVTNPWMPEYPLAYPKPGKPPKTVRVVKTEEKGSDVNLATWLLFDCFQKDFDEAVVISNDADLVESISLVRDHLGKAVGIVNPHKPLKMSKHLIKVASFYMRTINKKVLAASQFPPTLSDNSGSFSKPPPGKSSTQTFTVATVEETKHE